MVERGLGLAFLPHLAVARELRERSLVALTISDAEPLGRSLDVIHPRRRPLSPEALVFLQALRAAFQDTQGLRSARTEEGRLRRDGRGVGSPRSQPP